MKRDEKNAARRQAILDAALRVFSAKGFAAARVEDIAREAGVAKGTIYVHFADKDAVFAAIVHDVLAPLHGALSDLLARTDVDLRTQLWTMVQPFLANNGQSRVGMAVWLIHAEGLHNPHLVQPYLALIKGSLQRLGARMTAAGMPAQLCAHPHLIMAPVLHGLLWQGMFGGTAPMNLADMYAAYLDVLGVASA